MCQGTFQQDPVDVDGVKPGLYQSWVGWLVVKLLRSLRGVTKRPNDRFLTGHFEPVKTECFSNELSVVQGRVPAELNGLYIRTGPNPQNEPEGHYHWFSGDAMVHSLLFIDGQALSYQSHWLRTLRFLHEKISGFELWLQLGDLRGAYGMFLMGIFSLAEWVVPKKTPALGNPLGNTSIIFHAGKLMALMESGFPFLLRFCQGVVKSLGAFTYGGKLTHQFTAHPKVDPLTGEMLAFYYELNPAKGKPSCVYTPISRDGELGPGVPVDVSRPQIVHDFAITEHYAIFIDHSLIFDGPTMIKTGGMPFVVDKSKPSRIGLLTRAEPLKPIQWFNVEPFVFFHTANAWEEHDKVHVVLCKYETLDMNDLDGGSFATAVRYTVDLAAATTSETALQPDRSQEMEMPVVAPQLIGRPHRYMYAWTGIRHIGSGEDFKFEGWAKLDMTAEAGKGLVAMVKHGEGLRGGEAVYVPRNGAALAAGTAEEDDGFLIGYVTNINTMDSFCLIYDARTMDSEPVATIKLPARVPTGLHATFVTAAQLDSQS